LIPPPVLRFEQLERYQPLPSQTFLGSLVPHVPILVVSSIYNDVGR
jgi:hypothetical protein